MLEFQAYDFIYLTHALNGLLMHAQGIQEKHGPDALLTADSGQEIDDLYLKKLEWFCNALGMDAGVSQIRRIRAALSQDCNYLTYNHLLRDLGTRIADQFRDRFFVYLPPDKVSYYCARGIFGADVENRFPTVSDDIAEAGKCFAVGRYTATVFHLMRVMEVGVQELATALKIQLSKDQVWFWGKISAEIDEKIKTKKAKTPRSQELKRPFEEAAAYLHHVKDVWRNQVMHPKSTYTEEEAGRVLSNVKQFMQHLARIL
jgi:hypothetical protein